MNIRDGLNQGQPQTGAARAAASVQSGDAAKAGLRAMLGEDGLQRRCSDEGRRGESQAALACPGAGRTAR